MILAVAGGAGYFYYFGRVAAKPVADDVKRRTQKVEEGNIDLKVSTTGRVISLLDVEIKSKASGQITNLPFDVSEVVTSGALLAELDPVDELRNVTLKEVALAQTQAKLAQSKENLSIASSDLETQTSSAQAELVAARIKSADAEARLLRASNLFSKSLVSKEDLDAAQAVAATAANSMRQAEIKIKETATLPMSIAMRRQDVKLAEAEVKRAQVDLDNQRQRLRETRIFAPLNAVVTERTVQVGQIIASGISNVGGGTTLMKLSDLSRIFTNASVDESDIGKIKVGQRAVITADAFIGKRFFGRVVRVATKGVNSNNVVTFEVKIEIEGEGKVLLKPEMTTNIEIQADRREGVLTLPNEYVQVGRRGSHFVEVMDGDKSTSVTIETGLTDGVYTEILDGLTTGQEVAVPLAVQSRWAKDPNQQGGQSFARGMQRAAFMAAPRPGGGGGGGGGRGGR